MNFYTDRHIYSVDGFYIVTRSANASINVLQKLKHTNLHFNVNTKINFAPTYPFYWLKKFTSDRSGYLICSVQTSIFSMCKHFNSIVDCLIAPSNIYMYLNIVKLVKFNLAE